MPILDGAAAEDDPIEGAYTVPDVDERRQRGYQRMLRDISAERSIRRAPREVPLSPEESRRLFYEINGDRGLV